MPVPHDPAFSGKSRRIILSNDQETIDALEKASNGDTHVHIAILGTGFAGLGMAIRLKQQGRDDFVILEKAGDIGGTWRDNTYPGCACDIPSQLYSFSFALNPHWSRVYSPQGEICEYLRRCARRFGIMPHIRWNSELLEASWIEDDQCWYIITAQGKLRADILILGNGPLSEPSLPDIPGLKDFQGVMFHSAQWQHDYDFRGKRVAVIGTGASAVQFVPHIQPQVSHLSLFLRTPPWIVPRLDHAIPAWQKVFYSMLPAAQRFVRSKMYWQHELIAFALVYKPERMEEGMKLAHQHLARQVADPVLREKLTPRYTMGCKRILLSDDFYPAITQPNVAVITNHIREVRAHSIVTENAEGQQQEIEIDALICGTGFHVTDAPLPEHIYGRGGQSLAASWQPDPNAYLGTTVAGFPNLFLLIGPNTGLGHNSMIFMIESQLAYILDCLRLMHRQRLHAVEVQPAIQQAFAAEMQQRMTSTVWVSGCTSWYLDANRRNTTLWPGFTFEFWRRTRRFDSQHYNLTRQGITA
jgi:cation diffusion facilitator CzcD-associated flavoprotein CzcO